MNKGPGSFHLSFLPSSLCQVVLRPVLTAAVEQATLQRNRALRTVSKRGRGHTFLRVPFDEQRHPLVSPGLERGHSFSVRSRAHDRLVLCGDGALSLEARGHREEGGDLFH